MVINDRLKMYPIEIHVGGTVYGNIGIKSNTVIPGVITLFFEEREIQDQLVDRLQQATHNYNIKDFYKFSEKPKRKDSKRYRMCKKVTTMNNNIIANLDYVQDMMQKVSKFFKEEHFDNSETAKPTLEEDKMRTIESESKNKTHTY